MEYLQALWDGLTGMANWTYRSITFDVPWYTNYFWGLTLLSALVWGLELAFPWRKDQAPIRKDFWLDAFYMYANFFVFALFLGGFFSLLEVASGKMGIGMSSLAIVDLSGLPMWGQLLIFFVVLDFVQWATHYALHRVPALWQFHKVHHSVEEMGFAAHLRYHWMENVLYKPGKTLGVMVIGGFEPEAAYIVHFVAITIGHLNHANVKISWGPFKYLFNSPVMHLYHHARELPKNWKYGVNFGISLSLWDYIFRTDYVPEASGRIALGFENLERFPKGFVRQNLYGFTKGEDEAQKKHEHKSLVSRKHGRTKMGA